MLLGSGTSVGVPIIGCDCKVCTSPDPRYRRMRSSLLLRNGSRQLLVDCGPDFRNQALRFGVGCLDGVVLTHAHADHIMGLDDLRILILRRRSPMPIYGHDEVLDAVRRIYSYAFDGRETGSFKPRLDLRPLDAHADVVDIAGFRVQPIPVEHGGLLMMGLRLGDFAYLPDVKQIPPDSMDRLRGLDTLVIDALRHKPHATHLNLEEASAIVAELRPRQTWFTHLTHDIDPLADAALLPEGVAFAYDGLVMPVAGG